MLKWSPRILLDPTCKKKWASTLRAVAAKVAIKSQLNYVPFNVVIFSSFKMQEFFCVFVWKYSWHFQFIKRSVFIIFFFSAYSGIRMSLTNSSITKPKQQQKVYQRKNYFQFSMAVHYSTRTKKPCIILRSKRMIQIGSHPIVKLILNIGILNKSFSFCLFFDRALSCFVVVAIWWVERAQWHE